MFFFKATRLCPSNKRFEKKLYLRQLSFFFVVRVEIPSYIANPTARFTVNTLGVADLKDLSLIRIEELQCPSGIV